MKLNFKFLTGDVNWQTYGGKWISKKLNNGEFNFWFVIEFINWMEATGEKGENKFKYNISLSVVSPEQAGEENLKKALDCCGINFDDDTAKNDLVKVECLHSYGISATVWNQNGNNISKLFKAVRDEAQKSELLFGFVMDRALNKIGSTGWEFIKGDLDSGLARTIASGSKEGKILAKLHGIS